MAGELGAATVKIDLDSSKFSSGLHKAKGDFNNAAGDMENRASGLGSKIGGALVTGVAALTVSLAALGTIGVKTFMDIEAASADAASKMDIGKIASEQGIQASEAFTQVKEKVMALSDELGQLNTNAFDPTQISKMMAAMAAGGFDVAASSAKNYSGILAMATGTNYDLTKSAEIAMSTMNQFGMSASDLGKITDVYTMAAGKSAASMTDFDYAMQQAGPVAKGVGMSFEELTARIAKLADAGYGGEKSGTALRTAMVKLTSTTKPQMDALDKLGLTYAQVDPRVHSFSETLDLLSSKGADIYALGEIFGVEGMAVVYSTMKQQAAVKQLTLELQSSTGSAEAMAKMMLNTLSGSFDTAKGAASSLAYMIGGTLAPTLKSALDWFSSTGAPAIREFIQACIDGDWEAISAKIQAVFDAAAGIILGWAESSAKSILNAPWNLYIQQAMDGLVKAARNALEGSFKIGEWLASVVQGWISSGGPTQLGRGIGEAIIAGLKAAWSLVKSLWDNLKSVFGNSSKWLAMGWDIAKGVGGGLVDAFHPYIAKFYNYFVDKGKELIIWGATTGVGIANAFIGAFNAVLGGMQAVANSIYTIYESLIGKITTMLQAVGKAANESIKWVNETLGTNFQVFDTETGTAAGTRGNFYYRTDKEGNPTQVTNSADNPNKDVYKLLTQDMIDKYPSIKRLYEDYLKANPGKAIGNSKGFFEGMQIEKMVTDQIIKPLSDAYDTVFKKMDETAVYASITEKQAADAAAGVGNKSAAEIAALNKNAADARLAADAAANAAKNAANALAEAQKNAATIAAGKSFRDQITGASDNLAKGLDSGMAAVRIGLTESGQKIAVIGQVAQQQFATAGGKWVSDVSSVGSTLVSAGMSAGSALMSGASSAAGLLSSAAGRFSGYVNPYGNQTSGSSQYNWSGTTTGGKYIPDWMKGNSVFGYADGTETSGPELALIGEAGKEYVIPANGKRPDLLKKAMQAYGIPAMADGGEAGASDPAAAPAGMTATFGIAGLSAMSKDVQKNLTSLKNFFRITWGIIKSEAQVYWPQINKVVVDASVALQSSVWTNLIAMRNNALNEARLMTTQLGEQSKLIWPAMEPGITAVVTNTTNAFNGMAVIINATMASSLVAMLGSLVGFKNQWDALWSSMQANLVDTQTKISAAIKTIQSQLSAMGVTINFVGAIGGGGMSGGSGSASGGQSGGSVGGISTDSSIGAAAKTFSDCLFDGFTDSCTGIIVNALKYTNPQGVTSYINPMNYNSTGGISGYQGGVNTSGSNSTVVVGGSGGSKSGGSGWTFKPDSGLFGWGSSKLFGPTKNTGGSSGYSGGSSGYSGGGGYQLPSVFRAKGALEDEGARRVIVGEAGPELIIPTKYTNLLTAMADEFAGAGAVGSSSSQATIVVENNHYWNGRKMVDLVMTESKRRIEQKGVRASK